MKFEWENITQEIVPSLRAMIAQELINNYNLNQTEAAKLMGVSQPAVSQYLRRIRGKNNRIFLDTEILSETKKVALVIFEKKLGEQDIDREFTRLCKFAAGRSNGKQLAEPIS